MGRLDLQPGGAAAACSIRGVEALDHHALVAGGEHFVEELLCLVRAVRHHASHEELGRKAVEDSLPLPQGEVEQVAAVGGEHVEEERCQRQRAPGFRHVELGPEARHRDLEGMRSPVGAECDDLAVQDERRERQCGDDLDDVGQPVGDVLQVAREDADVTVAEVHLDTRPVQFGLDRHRIEGRDRRRDVVGDRRQHRLDGSQQRESHGGEAGCPFREGDGAGVDDAALHHGGASHVRGREAGSRCHRLDHHALGGALTQLAKHQPAEEVLLRLGRCREQAVEDGAAPVDGPPSGNGGECGQGLVNRL